MRYTNPRLLYFTLLWNPRPRTDATRPRPRTQGIKAKGKAKDSHEANAHGPHFKVKDENDDTFYVFHS